MYIGSTMVQECVAFLGYEDPNSPGGLKPEGTGFLISYQRFGYLVTARHVAERLGHYPFCLRINNPAGGSKFDFKDDAEWVFHPDETVDLAILEFNPVGEERLQRRFIDSELLLTSERVKELDIQPGCICYVVGLFRFLQGTDKNLPLVYTGNVSRMNLDERVPVYDEQKKATELSEVFLIEAHGINGLSGSPVFARQTRSITYPTDHGLETVLVPSNNLDLLGLFSGAWYLPPDAAVAATHRAKAENIVPVGVGMVVPAQKLVEILEMRDVKAAREATTGRSYASKSGVRRNLGPPPRPHTSRKLTSLLTTVARVEIRQLNLVQFECGRGIYFGDAGSQKALT